MTVFNLLWYLLSSSLIENTSEEKDKKTAFRASFRNRAISKKNDNCDGPFCGKPFVRSGVNFEFFSKKCLNSQLKVVVS